MWKSSKFILSPQMYKDVLLYQNKAVAGHIWILYGRDRIYQGSCFVLVLFSPFSIAITSLGEERANLSVFRTFVRFALVWFCLFPLPFGVWEGLRFVIVALPGLFSYLFLWLWHSLDFSLTFFGNILTPYLTCLCTVCKSKLICFPLGVIGRLCSVIVALHGHLITKKHAYWNI